MSRMRPFTVAGLRVPTGGGKTLLACYTAGLAIDLLQRGAQLAHHRLRHGQRHFPFAGEDHVGARGGVKARQLAAKFPPNAVHR